MTQEINNLSAEDLVKLRDALLKTRKGIKKTSIKSAAKSFAGLLASSIIIGGGVALAILIPSPITIAALGAVTMFKNLKEKRKERSGLKTEISIIDSKLAEKKTETIVKNLYPNIPPANYRPSEAWDGYSKY